MPAIDMNALKRTETFVEGGEAILTPISNLKFAQKDQIEKVKVANMRALVDDGRREINNRTIVPMDSEPMHLLQALQGMMVVVTNDYLKSASSSTVLFQLIGVPFLTQKAREVPLKYQSLTSSGLYILFTPRQVFIWVGSEFNSRYISPE